ncbi:MAG: hypothetical protein PV340_05310 [Wolbachia sp.]|nr:hypothetical protein [Wolbachia sp.]
MSKKQLLLWELALGLKDKEFSKKDTIEALGFPPRTVEAVIKKLLRKYLQSLGRGKATMYKVITERFNGYTFLKLKTTLALFRKSREKANNKSLSKNLVTQPWINQQSRQSRFWAFYPLNNMIGDL